MFYRPTDGDAQVTKIRYRPKACFLMTQLREPAPSGVPEIKKNLEVAFASHGFEIIDAESVVTGRDFLLKIWSLIVSVPVGIAIVHEDMPPDTLANVFYELGLLQAYGKETLIVKTPAVRLPSDMVRTEYVVADNRMSHRLGQFISFLEEQADYFEAVADQLDNNPLLAIDYLRRAFLLNGNERLRKKVHEVLRGASVESRAKNSVEMLLANF